MRRVIVESPYAGKGPWPLNVIRRLLNIRYARKCVRDAVMRGEAPIASHLLLTQPGILLDRDPDERRMGIAAGLAWTEVCDAAVVYTDRGVSEGMLLGVEAHRDRGTIIEWRSIKKRVQRMSEPVGGNQKYGQAR